MVHNRCTFKMVYSRLMMMMDVVGTSITCRSPAWRVMRMTHHPIGHHKHSIFNNSQQTLEEETLGCDLMGQGPYISFMDLLVFRFVIKTGHWLTGGVAGRWYWTIGGWLMNDSYFRWAGVCWVVRCGRWVYHSLTIQTPHERFSTDLYHI